LAGGISLPGYNSLVVIEFPSGNYHLLSGSSRYPIWSPDSRQLAFTHISSGLDIMDADGQNLKQIKATGVGIEAYPLFWTRGE
jgi:Tol biopolymer transport system component